MGDTAFGFVDCDVHPAAPDMKSLIPFLDDYWRETVVTRGIDGLDLSSFPTGAPAHGRADWRPDIGKPGSSLELMRSHLLGPFDTRFAILNCMHGSLALFNADLAAALARAVNDWLAAEWLDRDPRLRASMLVPAQDPRLAAEEIERRAADRRFVQVLMLVSHDMPLGKRHYWPIYAAAEKHGLPVGIHAGSGYRQPTTANGWPSYFVEDYVAQSASFQNQLLSLVAEGVFAQHPALKVVLIESGFTWLPSWVWRANKTWRGVRRETPWVDRPPSEIVAEHVRFTLQPTDEPPDPALFERVVEQMGSDDLILFSTDYPHWHFDEDRVLPQGLSSSLVAKIARDNPLATYPRLNEDGLGETVQ